MYIVCVHSCKGSFGELGQVGLSNCCLYSVLRPIETNCTDNDSEITDFYAVCSCIIERDNKMIYGITIALANTRYPITGYDYHTNRTLDVPDGKCLWKHCDY